MRWSCLLLLLAGLVGISAEARADEIDLKDGSKLVGSIVGYENGAFKVETAYGFAMIRKDSIAQIIPGEIIPGPSESARSEGAPRKSKTETTPASAAKSADKTGAAKPASQAPVKTAATEVPPAPMAAPVPDDPNSPPVAAAPAPAPKPKPVPVREEVGYNLYSNQTYGFSMFKPPSWDLLREARLALPEAITALGTSDGSTMLVIGRDTQGGALSARAAATALQLQQIYDHYRPVWSRQTTIAGLPAAEQRFRGNAEGHDWSVTLVTLERGNEVFTILGMTYADSDLIQLQENVIARSISSLQFTALP